MAEEITSAMSGRTYHTSAVIAEPDNPYQPLAETIHDAITPVLDPGDTEITTGSGVRDGDPTLTAQNRFRNGDTRWQLVIRSGKNPWFCGEMTPAALKAISIATETATCECGRVYRLIVRVEVSEPESTP